MPVSRCPNEADIDRKWNMLKDYPNSDETIGLFLKSRGLGVRDVDTSRNTGLSRRLGDKCREQLGDLPKNLFWSNRPGHKVWRAGGTIHEIQSQKEQSLPRKKRTGKTSCIRVTSVGLKSRLPTPILIALHLPLRRNWPWFPPGPYGSRAMSNKKVGITDPARSRYNICKQICCLLQYLNQWSEVLNPGFESATSNLHLHGKSFLQKNQILSLP